MNTQKAQALAQSFFSTHNIPDNNITLKHFHLLERHFKQGIATFTVFNNSDFVLSYTPSRYDKIGFPNMTVGLHASHAFLITDINKVTNNYTCGKCSARFTRADNLIRHEKTCTHGKTIVACPGKQIKAPDSAYESAFYPPTNFGYNAIRWIEHEARQRGIHIHHQLCGHGGERLVAGAYVDGYHLESKTVFQYHRCHFHGCPCYRRGRYQNEVLFTDCKNNQFTRAQVYQRTLTRSQTLRNRGYTVVEVWEHEVHADYNYYEDYPYHWSKARVPTKKNETCPHTIVNDFEAYQDNTFQPTQDLRYESEHVPISVSIAGTLNRESEFYEDVLRRSSTKLWSDAARPSEPMSVPSTCHQTSKG